MESGNRPRQVLLLPPSMSGQKATPFYVICEPRGAHTLLIDVLLMYAVNRLKHVVSSRYLKTLYESLVHSIIYDIILCGGTCPSYINAIRINVKRRRQCVVFTILRTMLLRIHCSEKKHNFCMHFCLSDCHIHTRQTSWYMITVRDVIIHMYNTLRI